MLIVPNDQRRTRGFPVAYGSTNDSGIDVRRCGLVIAYNMQAPAHDPRYVAAVATDSSLETLFHKMHTIGLGIALNKARSSRAN